MQHLQQSTRLPTRPSSVHESTEQPTKVSPAEIAVKIKLDPISSDLPAREAVAVRRPAASIAVAPLSNVIASDWIGSLVSVELGGMQFISKTDRLPSPEYDRSDTQSGTRPIHDTPSQVPTTPRQSHAAPSPPIASAPSPTQPDPSPAPDPTAAQRSSRHSTPDHCIRRHADRGDVGDDEDDEDEDKDEDEAEKVEIYRGLVFKSRELAIAFVKESEGRRGMIWKIYASKKRRGESSELSIREQ